MWLKHVSSSLKKVAYEFVVNLKTGFCFSRIVLWRCHVERSCYHWLDGQFWCLKFNCLQGNGTQHGWRNAKVCKGEECHLNNSHRGWWFHFLQSSKSSSLPLLCIKYQIKTKWKECSSYLFKSKTQVKEISVKTIDAIVKGFNIGYLKQKAM